MSPKLLYGTAWKQADTASLVRTAIQHGYRGIDTACQPKHYNEAGAGDGVARCLHAGLTRADLYLQTKFTPLSGQDPNNVPYDPDAPLALQVAQSFEVSLRNLQTGYLDALLLHSPLPQMQDTLQVWQAFESLVDSGRVRQLGISNCYKLKELETLCSTARIAPVIVQNRFYAVTQYDREIRACCMGRGITYQSFWTLTANPQLLNHATILAASLRHNRTPAQILYRYLTQLGIAPLTGTRSEVHMREDLAIFEFTLDAADLSALAKLF